MAALRARRASAVPSYLFGALGCGGLSGRYGRRRVALAAGVVFSAGALVAALA